MKLSTTACGDEITTVHRQRITGHGFRRVLYTLFLTIVLFAPTVGSISPLVPKALAGDCGPYIPREEYRSGSYFYGPGAAYCYNGATVSHSLTVCLRQAVVGFPDVDRACASDYGFKITLTATAVMCGNYNSTAIWTEARASGTTSRSGRTTYPTIQCQ